MAMSIGLLGGTHMTEAIADYDDAPPKVPVLQGLERVLHPNLLQAALHGRRIARSLPTPATNDAGALGGSLTAAGCGRVFEERASGGRWDRPELHRLLDQLRAGDVIIVWKLDRLSRSLKDLLHILEKIDAAGASFRSLTEAIDTSGPAGRMMMQMLGCFAEFERAMVRERTRAGLTAARAQGRTGGRRPKLLAQQRSEILGILAAGRTGADVARIFRVHRATISRIVAGARTIATNATSPAQGHPSKSVPEQNDRRSRRRTPPKS
jgi:DNA invertase Pin-like site-specific DNA recombinase